MGFDPDSDFWVDERVYEHMSLRERGAKRAGAMAASASSRGARRFPRWPPTGTWPGAGKLRDGWREALPTFEAGEEIATRSAGQKTMAAFAEYAPDDDRRRGRSGRVDQDGVRGRRRVLARRTPGATSPSASASTAMGAIVNGAGAHGGIVKPYGSTFLMFSDYMRGSVRLSALMGLPVVWVWTHDSVGLGEDGPTHQPIEHYAALRAIPHLWVIRPGDANETAAAWRVALEREDGPVALLLSRQNIPDARPRRGRRRRDGCRSAAATCCGTRPRASARADPDRHRRRGADDAARRAGARRARARACGSSRCPAWSCSKPSRRTTATRCCRPPCAPASPSSPARLEPADRRPGLDGEAGAHGGWQHLVAVVLRLGLEQLDAGHRDDAHLDAIRGERLGGVQRSRQLGACGDQDQLGRLALGRVPQHVAAALQQLRCSDLVAVERGDVLAGQKQGDGAVLTLQRGLPGGGGLVGVAGADHPQVGDRAQRGVVLDGLVRRAVLAEAHGVVCPHPHDRQPHQRRQPDAPRM